MYYYVSRCKNLFQSLPLPQFTHSGDCKHLEVSKLLNTVVYLIVLHLQKLIEFAKFPKF